MNLEELSAWLQSELRRKPELRKLVLVSIDDIWLPKTLEIETWDGCASLIQTAGYQEL